MTRARSLSIAPLARALARRAAPSWHWLLVLGLLAPLARAEDHVDPEGRYAISIPPGWQATARPGAVAAWSHGEAPALVSVWVETAPCAPGPDSTPLEAAVLRTVRPWLARSYSIAGSRPLDPAALEGQGVDQGVGLRLVEKATREQAFVVVMVRGGEAYVVSVSVPPAAATDEALMEVLPAIVSSFRVLDRTETTPEAEPPAGEQPATPEQAPEQPSEPEAPTEVAQTPDEDSQPPPAETAAPSAGPGAPGEETPPGAPEEPVAPPTDPAGPTEVALVGPEAPAEEAPAGPPAEEAGPPPPYVADLETKGSSLGEGWAWQLPEGAPSPPRVVVGGGLVRMACGAGSLISASDPTPILTRSDLPFPCDARIEVRDLPAETNAPVEVAMTFVDASGRSVALSRSGRGAGAVARLVVTRRGGREEYRAPIPGDAIQLRLWSDGETVVGLYSRDDRTWEPIPLSAAPIRLTLEHPRLGLFTGGAQGLPMTGIARIDLRRTPRLGHAPRLEGAPRACADGALEFRVRDTNGTATLRWLRIRPDGEAAGEVAFRRLEETGQWERVLPETGEVPAGPEVEIEDEASECIVVRLRPRGEGSIAPGRVGVQAIDALGLSSGWWTLCGGGFEPN